MIIRRSLLIVLVLTCLVNVGCAMYETRKPAAETGTVLVTWSFNQSFPDGRCGEAITLGPGHYLIRLRGEPPTFNDTARLECLGHEALHFMGAEHNWRYYKGSHQ